MSTTYMTAKLKLADGTIIFPQASLDNIVASISDHTLVSLATTSDGKVPMAQLPVTSSIPDTGATDNNVPTTLAVKTALDNATGAVPMTTTDRMSFIPDPGFLIWDTDLKRLFAGDGVTPGGNILSGGFEGNLVVPEKHYAVVGREANIYYDNLYKCPSSLFETEIRCASGLSQDERYTYTPASAGTLPVNVRTLCLSDYTLLASADTTLYVATASAGDGLTIRMSLIGDSLTQAGVITDELLNIAENDVMKLEMVGIRGTAPNLYEGRGGWTIENYTSNTATYYKFTVSGVTTAPAINSTQYTTGGSVFRVQEVELSDGAGTIIAQKLSGSAPSGSGILTKSNEGIGDATIAFSAVEDTSANPFWIGDKVDYGAYLTAHSFATPGFVFILLGWNDMAGLTSDDAVRTHCQTAFACYDTLISSIQAAGVPYIGLILCTPPCATQDGFAAWYGATEFRLRAKRNSIVWNEEMIKKYGDMEDAGIFIVPASTGLDTVHNFPTAPAAPANSRTTQTVVRQSNGVHPAGSGYRQIADVVWAFLKNKASLLVPSYYVTVASGVGSGSLYYGLATASEEVVKVSAPLNGQTLDLGGVVTSAGAKRVVGNGYANTIVSGAVTCTSQTIFSNLSMDGVVTSGGTMTMTDVQIVSGSTVYVSQGTVVLQNVVGESGSGTLDLCSSILTLPANAGANVTGCILTGGSDPSGASIILAPNTTNVFSECVFTGNNDRYGTLYINGGTTTLIDCIESGNLIANMFAATIIGGATCNISGGFISRSIAIQKSSDTVTFGGNVSVGRNVYGSGNIIISSGAHITMGTRMFISAGVPSIVIHGGTYPNQTVVSGIAGSCAFAADCTVWGSEITSTGRVLGATVSIPSSSCQIDFISSGEATVSSALVQANETPYVLENEHGLGAALVRVVED